MYIYSKLGNLVGEGGRKSSKYCLRTYLVCEWPFSMIKILGLSFVKMFYLVTRYLIKKDSLKYWLKNDSKQTKKPKFSSSFYDHVYISMQVTF